MTIENTMTSTVGSFDSLLASRGRFAATATACVLLTLGLSCLAVHADINYIIWVASYVADGHLNPYQAIFESDAKDQISGVTYPPITYLFFGAMVWLGRLFGLFTYSSWSLPMRLSGAEYLFIRLTLIPWLVLVAWVIRRFSERFIQPEADVSVHRMVFLLGLSSPVLVFVGFIFGQFDLLPSAALLLGIYLLCIGRLFWGVQAIFLGIWLKNFPVLILAFSLPLLVVEYGWKRVSIAVGVGLAATVGILLAFKSPGFKAGYLQFRHHQYDVLVMQGAHDVRVPISNLLFVGLFLLVVVLSTVKTRLLFWQKLLFVYSTALVFLLAPRFWMPQYIAWIAPVLVLVVLLWLKTEGPLILGTYLAFSLIYLIGVPVIWPGLVDSNLFFLFDNAGARPLAKFLDILRFRSEFWAVLSALLFFFGILAGALLVSGDRLRAWVVPTTRFSRSTQLIVGVVGSYAVILLLVLLQSINLATVK